jgi:hypothetical protein
MGKHNSLAIGEGTFSFARKDEAIRREKVLGGFYVILTSEPRDRLSTDDALRSYKSLAQVDEVFRSLKGLDLLIRPIWLRTEDHVKAHVFLCFLAYHWSGTCERPRRRSPQRERRDIPCGRPHRPDLHGKRKQPASRPRVFLSAPRVQTHMFPSPAGSFRRRRLFYPIMANAEKNADRQAKKPPCGEKNEPFT